MKKMYLTFALVGLVLYALGQEAVSKKDSLIGRKVIKDTAKVKPIADTVEYISNGDLKYIYRYISDRTTGTQYFEIFKALDGAINDVKRRSEERYRKKEKK